MTIISKPATKAYLDNWEQIFRKDKDHGKSTEGTSKETSTDADEKGQVLIKADKGRTIS